MTTIDINVQVLDRSPTAAGSPAATRRDDPWLAGRRWQWRQRRLPSEERHDGVVDPATAHASN